MADRAPQITVSFDRAGSLGIEFLKHEPPYVVEKLHAGGLAYNRDLKRGDLLISAQGDSAKGLDWNGLVQRLMRRPVTLVFSRTALAEPAPLEESCEGLQLVTHVPLAVLDDSGRRDSNPSTPQAESHASAGSRLNGDESDDLMTHEREGNASHAMPDVGSTSVVAESVIPHAPSEATESAVVVGAPRSGDVDAVKVAGEHAVGEPVSVPAVEVLDNGLPSQAEVENDRRDVPHPIFVPQGPRAPPGADGSVTDWRAQVEAKFAAQLQTAERKLEQVMFVVADKDKQLEEKTRLLSSRSDVINRLSGELGVSVEHTEMDTTFDVLLVLEGALGLDFEPEAPYKVDTVGIGISEGLGICSGDELLSLNGQSVVGVRWAEVERRLQARPLKLTLQRRITKQAVSKQEITRIDVKLENNRLKTEIKNLTTALHGRDDEVKDLEKLVKLKEETLNALESASGSAQDLSTFAMQCAALQQQVESLAERLLDAERKAEECQFERKKALEKVADESLHRETAQEALTGLSERCNTLEADCQKLRRGNAALQLQAKEKVTLEGEVQKLADMNIQWQMAHQALSQETEFLRQRTAELQQLETEVVQLRHFAHTYQGLQQRLLQVETSLLTQTDENRRLQGESSALQDTVQRLQSVLEAVQDSGAMNAGQLEAELLERSCEHASVRREADEHRRQVDELRRQQRNWQVELQESRGLKLENEGLKQTLASVLQERDALKNVVERCVAKLEKESLERPFLVDKRMVTQMMAAYLQQRDYPKQQLEIASKMADLLGFTIAERELVGLKDKRRTLLEQSPTGLMDLTSRFVDFLIEESESC
uniref:PDZ domain-containing protein n=1 Tax=Noctiluca scintillans TaxID=2966 RepID=A0A7S0ZXR3_NOCSC